MILYMNIVNNNNEIILPINYQLIDITLIDTIPTDYPNEFKQFCKLNQLTCPNIESMQGKALSAMLKYKYYYWNRETCDLFVAKFGICTKDSIQLFNKHSQWGIQTNSGVVKGKLYIIYPYCASNKHKMRRNFKCILSNDEKHTEINKIKTTIQTDYIDVSNDLWQLGHKNPGSIDNSSNNFVLQPPIQSKYRDNYIFIDTITKFPLPNKLKSMIEKKEIELTVEQIINYKLLFDILSTTV